MVARNFDVVIAGGGLAGSSLGGMRARSGLGVLVVEKEKEFRDRIRGELAWPWGHSEALRAGLGEALDEAGVVTQPHGRLLWGWTARGFSALGGDSIDALPAIAFSHPHLQETLLTWAASQGATSLRPAKVVGVRDGNRRSVTVVEGGRTTEFQARLTVGADRKSSGARRWLGADPLTDPEHHRSVGASGASSTTPRQSSGTRGRCCRRESHALAFRQPGTRPARCSRHLSSTADSAAFAN